MHAVALLPRHLHAAASCCWHLSAVNWHMQWRGLLYHAPLSAAVTAARRLCSLPNAAAGAAARGEQLEQQRQQQQPQELPSFRDLGVPKALIEGLHRMGVTKPTPVQTAAMTAILSGRHVALQSATGTGKVLWRPHHLSSSTHFACRCMYVYMKSTCAIWHVPKQTVERPAAHPTPITALCCTLCCMLSQQTLAYLLPLLSRLEPWSGGAGESPMQQGARSNGTSVSVGWV